MYTLSSLKWAIIAIAGTVLTVMGWHYAATAHQIFIGFSFAGPCGAVIGGLLFAGPQLGFSRESVGLQRRLLFVCGVVAVGFLVGVANTGLLKLCHPHDPIVQTMDLPDSDN